MSHQHADAPYPLALLPARRKWPYRHRAAEQRDELAAFQLIGLHSLPLTNIAAYRITEDQVRGSLQCGISTRLTSEMGLGRAKTIFEGGVAQH
jgi:hypothetical protein